MDLTLRERRIQSEWHLLTTLSEANPRIIQGIERLPDAVQVYLSNTPGWIAGGAAPTVGKEHWIKYVFPRYYPTLPPEAYCRRAPFHPNAHPDTGFLCLWADYNFKRTILDALVTTRAMLAHQAINVDARHCIQLRAFRCEPLEFPALVLPESFRLSTSASPGNRRCRLTSFLD